MCLLFSFDVKHVNESRPTWIILYYTCRAMPYYIMIFLELFRKQLNLFVIHGVMLVRLCNFFYLIQEGVSIEICWWQILIERRNDVGHQKGNDARTFLHTHARTVRSLLPDEVNSFDLNFAYTISTLESLCLDISVFSPWCCLMTTDGWQRSIGSQQ